VPRASRHLIPAIALPAYHPIVPPDQGGCREASCGRAGWRCSGSRRRWRSPEGPLAAGPNRQAR